MMVSFSACHESSSGAADRAKIAGEYEVPFDVFASFISEPKEHVLHLELVDEKQYKKLKATELGWLAPFRYEGDRRVEKGAIDCNLLGIDLDLSLDTYVNEDGKTKRTPGLTEEEVAHVLAQLEGLEYVGATTTGTWFLEDARRQKLRIFLPLSRPVTAREWARFRKQVSKEIGIEDFDDVQTHDLARCFFFTYLFAGADPTRMRVFRGHGEAIDVDLVLEQVAEVEAEPMEANGARGLPELATDSPAALSTFEKRKARALEMARGLPPPGRGEDTWKRIGSIAWTLAQAARYVSDQQRHGDALREIEAVLKKRDPKGYEKEVANLHASFERGLTETSPLERPLDMSSRGIAEAVSFTARGLLYRLRNAKTRRDGWLAWSREEGRFVESYGGVVRMIRDYAESRLNEIERSPENEEFYTAVAKWVRKLNEPGAIRDVVEELAAREELLVDESAFDAEPMVLNCANGVLDLTTGHLHEHHPSFMCRKKTESRYLKNASAPVFEQFLVDITAGDNEVATYLMRFFGYALSGSVEEDCFLYIWGDGGNGKSTLLETITRVLGDYATNLDGDLLTKTRNEKHPTGIARLQGARLASGPEINADEPFDEALLKRLTGRDRIVARRMGQDFFEFEPTHKFVLSGNNFPRVRGTDHGFWRRVRVVHLTQKFEKERGGKALSRMDRLLAERDAIFTQLVKAHIEWSEKGLAEPPRVRAWAEAYRTESNTILQWLAECVTIDPEARCGRTELYQSYKVWAEREGTKSIPTATWFTQQIRKLPGVTLDERFIVVQGKKQQTVAGVRLFRVGDEERARKSAN